MIKAPSGLGRYSGRQQTGGGGLSRSTPRLRGSRPARASTSSARRPGTGRTDGLRRAGP